ncbi:5-methylthioadenosine/S-adenosylhomocysteine deaminase [Plasticicumulans lactativorans]|uniref:5-methylthioadenosine/S-adenosylhomocysteine deaminase n=1 Tax=Plasticicumulans lactativorans TaxID=1133106 RepID=A0A4R2LJU5_9GAMM|nr:TRZ/ATZ family hydrolase [Plasticicumulans lactativorans]TCO83506.1 5-methylthioadenosine/S-adenosylhomocysteine deaminase [Plasticicumulans lactativorans]
MLTIDTLLFPRWIVPVEPAGVVLEGHALAIDQGRILDVLPAVDAAARYLGRITLHLPSHGLIPGLVNAHAHAAMSLLRGLADDLPLHEWLTGHIWPTEGRWVSEAFVHDGTQLAMAEMLRGGITCFNDMYFFPDVTARAASAAGMRACVGLVVIDFPSAWASGVDEYLDKGLALHENLRHDPLISTAFAPHAPYTVAPATLERVRTLADELERPIHIHLHETAAEVDEYHARHGRRPLAHLDALGLLSPELLAVHMTQLDDAEIARVAETGVHVLHCPESNLKLASGFCPVARLLAAGVNVALGTDGAASNNDLDMFGEMRSAALLAKAVAGDAAALPAGHALHLATLGGARALGLDADIGSLLPGKWADVTAVDFGALEAQPLYHPLSQLVYASGRHQVTDVWVAGRHLLKNRVLTTLDADAIHQRARAWRDTIANG